MNIPHVRDAPEKSAASVSERGWRSGRSRREAVLAAAAAWVALTVGMVVGGEADTPISFGIGGAIGAGLVAVGFAAASRCRTILPRSNAKRARVALLALAAGTALGVANLVANWMIAEADPALHALIIDRLATINPVEAAFSAPMMEEPVFRLFLLSVIAWIVHRITKRTRLAFGIALIGSAVIFASAHLGRPLPDDPVLADFYRTALMIKYTALALPLGWIFWRWGLPYAMLCHGAANAAHSVFQNSLF